MQRAEAERAVRYLCHQWRKISENMQTPESELSFLSFHNWLRANHAEYLEFRSKAGPTYDLELWFDQEFKQTWSR